MKHNRISDISNKDVVVIYKHSRYSYILDRGSDAEKNNLLRLLDPFAKQLLNAHEKNLLCIDTVKSILTDLRIKHNVICRSDMKREDLIDRFVIAIGGDGTLLDCSHYCDDSPILGVNSDPASSIGALCAANVDNFRQVLTEILHHQLLPTAVTRLQIRINDELIEPLATNDVLFCNNNPASLSRFSIRLNEHTESHRSSGIWISSAAGSTGGIYSAGATPLPLEQNAGVFRMREAYWSDEEKPHLLDGLLGPDDKLTIMCNMTDGEIFIDGPHVRREIAFGASIEVMLSKQFLWLFDGPRLNKNRERIIERRKTIQSLLK